MIRLSLQKKIWLIAALIGAPMAWIGKDVGQLLLLAGAVSAGVAYRGRSK
ncbi:MAG: hypothetical protein M0R47_16690 [Methylobacter sp.]|nr:hypothetical protein [Methylobacter sp.]MCK9622160.1 hypothetical protein [Methylobacter sp.]